MKKANVIFIFLIFILASGCGGGQKAADISKIEMDEVSFNKKAAEAFGKEDYQSALAYYEKALRAARSVEDIEGMGMNLVNMAVVYRTLKENDKAIQYADEVINSTYLIFPAGVLSQAAEVKAMLNIDEGEYGEAALWAEKALSYCSGCTGAGRIHNIKARTAFMEGDYEKALEIGRTALELSKKNSDNLETANALRIMGDSKLKKEKFDEAKALYEESLHIDKRLGLSEKISADLLGIGSSLEISGKYEDALGCYQRALSVSNAARDEDGISKASGMIERLKARP